jgi:DNA-binding XRE family transcriptional regulator
LSGTASVFFTPVSKFETGVLFFGKDLARRKTKMSNLSANTLQEVALRIREMREIFDFSVETMAQKTEVSVDEYIQYES